MTLTAKADGSAISLYDPSENRVAKLPKKLHKAGCRVS